MNIKLVKCFKEPYSTQVSAMVTSKLQTESVIAFSKANTDIYKLSKIQLKIRYYPSFIAGQSFFLSNQGQLDTTLLLKPYLLLYNFKLKL